MDQTFEEFIQKDSPESHFYNVSINVLEASNLAIENMVSRVCVQLGREKRYTKIKDISDRPYYNEYFVFDFYGTITELLQLLLTITLFRPAHCVKKKKVLGSARFDLATIWIQPDHHISQKWLILTDPDDPTGKIKGYLKCDIGIVAPQQPLLTKFRPRIKELDIEREYFIPERMGGGKLSARYIIRIHSGFSIFSGMHNYGFLKRKKKLKGFVRLYFAGLSANTSSRGSNRFPTWNEEIIFTEKFPPLYNRLRIELHLCKNCYCSRYINLSDISDSTVKGFMPTFGPAYIHFYEPPYNYNGSLLISIDTKTVVSLPENEKLLGVKRTRTADVDESMYWSNEEFIVYGIIYNISMLDQKSTNKRVLNCKLSFGEYGGDRQDTEFQSSEADLKVIPLDENYNCVEIKNTKTALLIKQKLPDNRNRLFISNKLHYIYRQFRRDLISAHSKSETSPKDADKLLRNAFNEFKIECTEFIKTSFPGSTVLDKERIRMLQLQLKGDIDALDSITDSMTFHFKFKKAVKIFKNLEGVIEDPQDSFPYVVFKLCHDEKVLGYVNIPARDILFSASPKEKGLHCGEIQHIYLNDANRNVKFFGHLEIFLWFSTYKSFGFCLEHIPPGYEEIGHLVHVPTVITYNSFSIVKNTLSPHWKETIEIKDLSLVQSAHYIKKFPLTLEVEIWINSSSGKFISLLGRFLVFPYVYLANDTKLSDYPPPLQWFSISSNKILKGELLAMFELIEVTDDPSSAAHEVLNTIPDYIRPKIIKYRLEILFWGIRVSKLKDLTSVNNPKIVIDCGDVSVTSDVMKSASTFPNFVQSSVFSDIEIPENTSFTPPMIMRLFNNRGFGHFHYLGSHTVHDIKKFIVELIPKQKWLKYGPFQVLTVRDSTAMHGLGSIGIDMGYEGETLDNVPLAELKFVDKPKVSEVKHQKSELIKPDAQKRSIWKYLFSSMFRKSNLKLSASASTSMVHPSYIRAPVPDPDSDEHYFDWWTKYYECVDRLIKPDDNSPSGRKLAATEQSVQRKISKITIYTNELEKQSEFNQFSDTLRTFDFLLKDMKLGMIPMSLRTKFKGAISMYRLEGEEEGEFVNYFGNPVNANMPYFYGLGLRSGDTIALILRVYIVRGHRLHSRDEHGTVDPYIEIQTASKHISDSIHYIVQDDYPVFGKSFELDATLPFDSLLTVRIMDWDRLGSDLIGETVIDIENRYFSRHRATCAIPQKYNETGYNKWRDIYKPSQILANLCKTYSLEEPKYNGAQVIVGNATFYGAENKEKPQECAALTALKHWDQLPIVGCPLVKEHVETRSLYDPKHPDIEQGKIEMWVDMFAKDTGLQLPPILNITPRKPESYELRVVVWNTSSVVMKGRSVLHGKYNTDIYIKGWMKGKDDLQRTDVHFSAVRGEGMFNWRFIFCFSHIREEKMIIFDYKPFEHIQVNKQPPVLYLQLWDNERFHSDEYLGSLTLDLHRIPVPIKDITKRYKIPTFKFFQTSETIDLFSTRHAKGWWPFLTNTPKYSPKNLVGLVELEFTILTAAEAESFPAGKGRNEPDALPMPIRPSVKWTMWVVPFRAIWIYVCGYHKRALLMFILTVGLIYFALVFIYSIPKYSVKKILNA